MMTGSPRGVWPLDHPIEPTQSDTIMITLEPDDHQTASMATYVGSLSETCVRRFRESALLVGADLNQWSAIKNFFMERIYPKRLTPFWRQVCLRYNREIYNPQLALSLGRKDFMRDGNKDDCEITNFNRFVYFVFGLL